MVAKSLTCSIFADMFNYQKLSYVNISKEKFVEELNNRGVYYSNIVIWSILFSLPLFWLLDLLFLKDEWVDLIVIRLIFFLITYLAYWYGTQQRWNYLFILNAVVGVNVVLNAVICGLVKPADVMPYFLIFSVMVLLLNSTVFWRPYYSLVHIALSYAIIVLFCAFKNKIDGYSSLVVNGGGVYFLVSAFSVLITNNRYLLLKRETEKNLIIEESKQKLMEQNEHINDQGHVIAEKNRRLKQLSDYRQNTLNIMLHDLKNFVGSNQISIDLISKKDTNLTGEQKELLGYINMGNRKLHYLSGKLADSAEAETGVIEYKYEEFDIIPEIENVGVSLVETAGVKEVQLQFHLTPEKVNVHLDKLFTNHTLYKLISNAIRFAEKGSVVSLHATKESGFCVIEVINNGKAIGKRVLDEFFSKMVNPNDYQNPVNESGFGFSVAKKLTETMGGELYYSSTEHTGNYYRIKFKLA